MIAYTAISIGLTIILLRHIASKKKKLYIFRANEMPAVTIPRWWLLKQEASQLFQLPALFEILAGWLRLVIIVYSAVTRYRRLKATMGRKKPYDVDIHVFGESALLRTLLPGLITRKAWWGFWWCLISGFMSRAIYVACYGLPPPASQKAKRVSPPCKIPIYPMTSLLPTARQRKAAWRCRATADD